MVTATPADAYDPRPAAVSALAALDGVARHCRYDDRKLVIRNAVRAAVAADEALSRTFDRVSDQASRQSAHLGHACPGAEAFGLQVEAAITRLRRVFRKR